MSDENGLSTATQEEAMDVKTAVGYAKGYIEHLFGDEDISNLLLEEVEFEDVTRQWVITVSFNRHTTRKIKGIKVDAGTTKSFKQVKFARDGRIIAVRDRFSPEANG